MTEFALWLNDFFAPMDDALLEAYHALAGHGGGFWTPFFRLVTLIGEKGIWMLALAVVLMLFARTRKMGICLFGAVCCGALITNICLKDAVCRLRPFLGNAEYEGFWQFIGAPAEDGFSFPSGHATAAAAGSLALLFAGGRKYLAFGVPYVSLMCAARNYLMAHYPSDVLVGVLIGAVSACVAWAITCGIYRLLEAHPTQPFCRFVLRFDLRRRA